MSERFIDAVLRLKDEFTKPMSNALGMMTEASKQGDRARKNFAKMGKGIADVGKTMTAAVTMPLVGLGAASYKTFEGVDKQLALVKATMGETAYATADLSEALKDAAVNSIYSMEDGAEALVNYARQGFNAAEAADMLAPAMALAAGTSTDLAEVTSGLGNTLKAFGADSAQAAHYADMFTVAQAQANTTAQGLFDAMSVAGPVAKTVGWSFEDIATLTGVFGDASIDATEGANALKTGLARLAAPAKQGAEAMEKLGINIFDEYGTMKAMPEVIGELQKGFSGLSQEQALSAASAIFGKNQMSKWLALINGPGVEGLQEMRDNISGASGEAQAASDALVTPLEKLSSTFDVFKTTVGETLATTLVPFIEKATEIIDKFRQMSPEQQQQIVKWAAIAAAIGPVLMLLGNGIIIISKIFGALSKLRGALAVVKAGFGAVKTALAGFAAPALAAIAVIGAIIVVVMAVVKHFNEFKEAASRAMEKIQPSIDRLKQSFEGLQTAVGPVINFIVDLVGNVLLGAFTGLLDAVGPIIDGIAQTIEGISKAVQGVVTFVTAITNGDWSTAWHALGDVVTGVAQAMVGVINTVVGAVEGIVGAIGGAITKLKEYLNLQNQVQIKGGGGMEFGENAAGTPYWKGGFTWIGEKGPELVNLPRGTEIMPHEASVNYAAQSMIDAQPTAVSATVGSNAVSITIPKLADQIIVREDADIDRLGRAVAHHLTEAGRNRGSWTFAGMMA